MYNRNLGMMFSLIISSGGVETCQFSQESGYALYEILMKTYQPKLEEIMKDPVPRHNKSQILVKIVIS